MVFRPSLQAATLVASVLSCISTLGALSFVFTRRQTQKSLRHSLVVNLLVAEFINSCNNSVSGIISLTNRGVLQDGPACTANGFLGQFSVQAVDFGVLSIAISTLFVVIVPAHDSRQSLLSKILACVSVWIIGLVTSKSTRAITFVLTKSVTAGCIASGLQVFGPVSGNWCWIKSDELELRYALAHGWRFTIILGIIAIYTYITFRLGQHFGWIKQNAYTGSSVSNSNATSIPMANGATTTCYKSQPTDFAEPISPVTSGCQVDVETCGRHNKPEFGKTYKFWAHNCESAQASKPILRNIHARVVLSMTAYPVMYILLWSPGIANRAVEATGHTSLTLNYLQASTQL
ncbi:hypothetical protein D6D28_09118, partial [Aureobasidium pullulans]